MSDALSAIERFSRERFAREISAVIDETTTVAPGVRW